MLNIDIGKIKNAGVREKDIMVSAAIAADAYGYDDFRLLSPCEFQGSVSNLGDYLEIRGEARMKIELTCDSCGELFPLDLSVPFSEYYSLVEETPDLSGERDIHLYAGERIDISPEILKDVFLELPMKTLCREDCRGLCQYCGKNLNFGPCACNEKEIDPRLERLKEFNDGKKKGV